MQSETASAAELSWLVRSKMAARHESSYEWAQANGAPPRVQRILKSAVGPSSFEDIHDVNIVNGGFVASLRNRSLFYRCLQDNLFTRAPLRTRLGLVTSGASGATVQEGRSVPVSKVVLSSNFLLEPVKAAALIVATQETLEHVGASGQALLSRELKSAVADAVDATFLDLVVDTSTDGVAIDSTGSTGAHAKRDLRNALMAVNTLGEPRLVWACAADVAAMAATLAQNGIDVFPAMSPQGGEMANLPAVMSSTIPSGTIYLIDCQSVAADGGAIDVKISRDADVSMLDNPSMSSKDPVAAQMTSLFQTNSAAALCTAFIGAARLRENAIAAIQNISWGDFAP